MKQREAIIVAFALCAFSAAASAGQVTDCKMGSHTRHIEVTHVGDDPKKACEVRYVNGDAPAKVLWNYQHQSDQCAAKAEWFAKKLSGMGWTCAAAAPGK